VTDAFDASGLGAMSGHRTQAMGRQDHVIGAADPTGRDPDPIHIPDSARPHGARLSLVLLSPEIKSAPGFGRASFVKVPT
jgi:hypothetical protein